MSSDPEMLYGTTLSVESMKVIGKKMNPSQAES